jgi:archaellum biogenesis ATPase FlaH
MHLYGNRERGKKVLSASNPVVKSVYMNEQTVMLYVTDLTLEEALDPGMFYNLVLD